MTLANSISADATTVFLQTDDFAEQVTYIPYRYFGEDAVANRTINAVVIRRGIEVLAEDGVTVAPVWEVHVANDSTTGISSDELDLGGDKIQLPPRDNETAEARSITQLLTQDAGMLVLELR